MPPIHFAFSVIYSHYQVAVFVVESIATTLLSGGGGIDKSFWHPSNTLFLITFTMMQNVVVLLQVLLHTNWFCVWANLLCCPRNTTSAQLLSSSSITTNATTAEICAELQMPTQFSMTLNTNYVYYLQNIWVIFWMSCWSEQKGRQKPDLFCAYYSKPFSPSDFDEQKDRKTRRTFVRRLNGLLSTFHGCTRDSCSWISVWLRQSPPDYVRKLSLIYPPSSSPSMNVNWEMASGEKAEEVGAWCNSTSLGSVRLHWGDSGKRINCMSSVPDVALIDLKRA